jgi:predicted AlkP superfamily phosphohydrolase/phosphomutase
MNGVRGIGHTRATPPGAAVMRRAITAALLLCAGALVCVGAGCGSKPPMKVVVVGIDGMDWRLADPLLEQGKMPNLARVIDQGMRADLHSLVPLAKSPTIWTTIATGKGVGKHGIGGFVESTGEQPLMNSTGWRARSVWDILGEKGYTVGVLNWLVTWPARAVNGYCVSDKIAYSPEDGYVPPEHLTYPEELVDELAPLRVSEASTTDDDVADLMTGVVWRHGTDAVTWGGVETCKSISATDQSILRMSNYLLENKEQPDLYAVYFLGLDRACHRFWGQMVPGSTSFQEPEEVMEAFKNVIPRYYERADAFLGDVLNRVDENTTVIVCSDHGFRGPIRENGALQLGVKMHREIGVLAAMGPGIRRGARLTDASVLDITPTILALMGEPVGRDMDGYVLNEMIDKAYLDTNPVRYIDTYESEVVPGEESGEPLESPLDDAIKEELRSLGYIE